MKIMLSTHRNKSFSDRHCTVPPQGVLVGCWSEESLARRALSFRMDEVASEQMQWEVRLE